MSIKRIKNCLKITPLKRYKRYLLALVRSNTIYSLCVNFIANKCELANVE